MIKSNRKKLFANQLSKVGVKSEKELTFYSLVILMSNVIEDFIEENISLYDLSSMFRLLFEEFHFHRSEKNKDKFSEIINILEYGSEFHYDSTDCKSYSYTSILFLMRFYINRKTILANVEQMNK